jgi:MSHA pilin protein MshC
MDRKGFTLIELVMVLVLIGIIAVVAAPRLANITVTNSGAFSDKLKADVRYAQNLAMTKGQRYRVYFNTNPAPANGYAVVYDTSGGGWTTFGFAPDPAGGGNLSVTVNAGQYAGITVSTPAGGFIEFNSLGVPTAGGGATITVFANASAAATVVITSQSGAVN